MGGRSRACSAAESPYSIPKPLGVPLWPARRKCPDPACNQAASSRVRFGTCLIASEGCCGEAPIHDEGYRDWPSRVPPLGGRALLPRAHRISFEHRRWVMNAPRMLLAALLATVVALGSSSA